MPCNSDYMSATSKEIEISRVACLLDEIAGRKWEPGWWAGYHPRVYNMKHNGDKLVNELCAVLQSRDVTQYSLEMQVWWRDHQAADKARIAKETAKAKNELL